MMALHLVKHEQGVLDLLWQEAADPELWGALMMLAPTLAEHFSTVPVAPGSFGAFLQTMLHRYANLKATGTCDRAPLAPAPHVELSHAALPLPYDPDEPTGTPKRP